MFSNHKVISINLFFFFDTIDNRQTKLIQSQITLPDGVSSTAHASIKIICHFNLIMPVYIM